MKKSKLLTTSIMLALACGGSIATLSGCEFGGKNNTDPVTEEGFFAFSVALQSGASQIQIDKNGAGAAQVVDKLVVYDNGIDTAGKSYKFYSTRPEFASIDENTGEIKALKASKGTNEYVNFYAVEQSTSEIKQLTREVKIIDAADRPYGGFNFSGAADDESLEERAKILGELEKYSMNNFLTGITLFDNGGYVKYSSRVHLPASEYITGYGFGLLSDGYLTGSLTGNESGIYPDYYHSAISQDSLKINQYNATGSQVSDLASYITATYWSTKLDGTTAYKWYPCLATEKIYTPTVTGYNEEKEPIISYSQTKEDNNAPVPMEVHNQLGLYKKWRIYVKTDGDLNGSVLKYHTKSTSKSMFDNRGVTLEDYEFIYKLLLTQTNRLVRGTEMANDTSYGIKGAQRYYNDTANLKNIADIDKAWNSLKDSGKLGIHTGTDSNGAYLDLELVNAIDSFTAMYTLSSSLVCPLPEDFFVGANAIGSSMSDSAKKYGAFNSFGDNAIIDYTLSCGPYQLEEWRKKESIVFSRNDDWFEYNVPTGQEENRRYKIPGVYNRVIDTSTDTEKVWKQFEAGNLDAAGVPTTKVANQIGQDGVKRTKGDSTFKLNVNSCTEEEWNVKFGKEGNVHANASWNLKPWMSNQYFLDGLFYSIDRKSFAEKRGVTPSINYFSDAYMSNPQKGESYNETSYHKEAVYGYETFDKDGKSDYGYNYDKAVDSFRNAVSQLCAENKLSLGTKENPTPITVHIRWMYQTDKKEYGEDIAYYFEKAFNDESVCGGKVKLTIEQEGVSNWEDVYNLWMMQGQFDLGFGAISGNTYNPLNFMEVLKSNNSTGFTLNWGPDTGVVDEINPIVYNGKEWSFDGLWEVADHGGIINNGEVIKPVNSCIINDINKLGESKEKQNELYNGFDAEILVDFAKFSGSGASSVEFDFSRLDISISNKNITLTENNADYDPTTGIISFTVDATTASEINEEIKKVYGYDKLTGLSADDYKNNPFLYGKYGYTATSLFNFELYYTLSIDGNAPSENYYQVALA